MAQQTLTKPGRQAPRRAATRGAHRRPRTRTPRRSREREVWWAVPLLTALFAVFMLLGAGLTVNGPEGSSSAARPPVSLAPQDPNASKPPQLPPLQRPVENPDKPAQPRPGRDAAKPAAVKKTVALRPGDTLYALALKHGTSVKALQKLNNLGSSTLIYAGDTLRVQPATGPTGQKQSGGASHQPAPAPRDTGTGGMNRPAKDGAVAVAFARAQLGKPYIWGGTGPRGYDCSGLVMRAWKKAGVQLPRTTWGQVEAGTATTRGTLVPGDLVISHGGGHVQLYIGNGKVIHAPRSGSTVTVAPVPPSSQVVAYRHITA